MILRRTTIGCALAAALISGHLERAHCQEGNNASIAIKMVLQNYQVKAVRKAKGNLVSINLTNAQKKLIRVRAPKFKGLTIRLSTAHLRKGSNKIDLLLIRPTSTSPLLRVLQPVEKHPTPPEHNPY